MVPPSSQDEALSRYSVSVRSDIVADMRKTNVSLRRELDAYKEINRILLTENIDLKDYFEEKGISIEKDLTNLKEVYSVFAEENTEDIDGQSDNNTTVSN